MSNSFFKNNKYYEETKRINTLPFASYFIPFDIGQDFEYKEGIIDRTKSKLFISLDGKWNIKAHKNLQEIDDINEEIKDEINVPSCVQFYGYDYNQYTNLRYPFTFNPPYVPKDNPVFHYRKKIKLEANKNYELCFDGVDSAFYLFVNSQFVGYSQITHSLSKFNISEYVVNGNNTIDVVVLKWCASSYLEDQDKFRLTGIFRSVYILKRENNSITDFKIETDIVDGKGLVKVSNFSKINFKVLFNYQTQDIKSNDSHTFIVNDPILWDDANPYLYDLILQTNCEKIMQKVGIRRVFIENGVFKINNKHIKLKGVNRHEFHPDRGAAITFEDTIKDLKLIKSLNANAIRTSHYPDMPEFYELCNYLGIYVVDEADVETHGVCASQGGYDRKLWQEFANNGLFDDAIFDREVSLYERDKNYSCVIIWSLGNESSYGKMFYAGADYIHVHDNRPIHYESNWETVDRSEYYTTRIDIASRMYPEISWLTDDYLNDEKETRPLMLCEYSHSMGNSNGDLADYWKVLNSSDRFIGAFVWEFCDHAINVDGKLLYGGDFGEKIHDGNFCIDGLLDPYRNLKTNTLELKAVYSGKLNPDKEINKCEVLPKLDENSPMEVEFDDTTGSIVKINGKQLSRPIQLNYLRANTDNDNADMWKLEPLFKAKTLVKSSTHNKNIHKYSLSIVSDNLDYNFVDIELSYYIFNDSIDIEIEYEINSEFDYVQRIGVEFALNGNDEEFTFFGYGPDESYIDKRIHNSIGEFTKKVSDNYHHYLKPQESGSHYYTSYLKFSSLEITAEKPFSFNVLPYSKEMLMSTKHDFELSKKVDEIFISLDVNIRGIGSHSCGPELLEKYRIPKKDRNRFRLKFK